MLVSVQRIAIMQRQGSSAGHGFDAAHHDSRNFQQLHSRNQKHSRNFAQH